MSEQGSSGEASGGAAADAVATRARQRHARDKGLVEAARGGDRTAFGKLYDEWVDSVYDRAVHAGASAAEAREITEQTFLVAWRDLAKLKQPAAFGAKVLQVARRETAARVTGGEKIVPKSGPSAEERLTRATVAADAAADPEAAAVLREAAHALDEQTRDVLDLHYRLGLTRNEVAAVLGEEPDKVAQTIAKLPPALAVLTRARVLWRGGTPEDDGLQAALAADNVRSFNASAVRTINRYAKDNDQARARSLMGVAPVELFAAIPLADAPAGLKTAVASVLVVEAVPMDGSAFVKRDDKGEIVDAPKPPPPPDGSVRPGIENKRPTLDPKKAAAVAAAALAAERAADDKSAAEAAAAEAPGGRSRRDRKNDKAAATAALAATAATAAAAGATTEPAAAATDLSTRKSGGAGSGAKLAGAAAGGAVLGAAGVASAKSGGTSTFPAADAPAPGAPTKGGSSAGSDAPTTEVPAAKGGSAGSSSMKAKTVVGAGAAAGAYGAATKGASAKTGGAGPETSATTTTAGASGGRAGEKYVSGSGPGKWIAIGVAAAVVIALIAFFATRGGDTRDLATGGSPNTSAVTTSTAKAATSTTEPTTTLLPTTTTETPTETTPETTVAPVTPTTKGGATTPTTQAPPPTEAPTTTVAPAVVSFSLDPVRVIKDYDPNASTSPRLSWTVSGGDATVTVEGPGFSSTALSASNQTVCPVPLTDGLCKLQGVDYPKEFAYRITVRQPGVSAQIQQRVLTIYSL